MASNIKEVRERLKYYKVIRAEKRGLELKLEELKRNIGIQAVSNDRVGKSYSISNTTEKYAMRIIEQEEKIKKFNFDTEKGLEIEQLDNALSVLKDLERRVIEIRCIKEFSWESVTRTLYRSESHLRAIEAKALDKINNILNISSTIM